ncbi:MAG: hypothetical protein QOG85_2157, partial [Gaiellaceae bacterium]|nr:hypothetical protein [Gaiellaceae bacterium]
YGSAKVWPGDTFGLSTRDGAALVSWGSGLNRRRASQIYFAATTLPSG